MPHTTFRVSLQVLFMYTLRLQMRKLWYKLAAYDRFSGASTAAAFVGYVIEPVAWIRAARDERVRQSLLSRYPFVEPQRRKSRTTAIMLLRDLVEVFRLTRNDQWRMTFFTPKRTTDPRRISF